MNGDARIAETSSRTLCSRSLNVSKSMCVASVPVSSCSFAWRSSFVNVSMPHSVWWMTANSVVPSSRDEITSERSASSEARPPALRIMWASPISSPSAFSGWMRASMQVMMATFFAGGVGLSPWLKVCWNSWFAVSMPLSSDTGTLLGRLDAILAVLDPRLRWSGEGRNRARGYDGRDVRRRPQRLDAQLRALPDQPGVYLFRSEDGDVIYVGKAKSLRKRVTSYFRRDLHATVKTAGLVERIDEIEFVAAASETEALLLEQNLIKRHRPAFNIRLRDDKSYPYIAVTVGDEYPRVMFTRERHRKGVLYFGPYASAKKVRETLDVLNRVFPYRPCEGPQPGRRSGVPCLDYHIGRCAAPCVGYIGPDEYRAVIDSVVEFLSGRVRPLERRLEAEMKRAATEHEFEDAARYRNRLMAVRHLSERQVADRRSLGSADILGIACSGDTANVQLFHLRDGRLSDRHGFY